MKDQFFNYIQDLQNRIIAKLEEVDGEATFLRDNWTREEGGGGLSCVLTDGAVFEKAGVNISKVYGELPVAMQKALNVNSGNFFACGLSLVIHPKSPHIPTTHANWRYFEMYDADGNVVDQWFGGGQDLTPYYLDENDGIHWHTVCKKSCDAHNPAFYEKYKKECDKYFWNTHREEARGIGGLFFDYLKPTEVMSVEQWFAFVTEVGNSFLEAYVPIVEKHKEERFTPAQKEWQEIRRGRYVEFNLIHDRGTLFGLRTNGRIESILMSLPKHVQWHYNHHPVEGSEEYKIVEVLRNPKDWI
ncbi:oxygen-dependent coproporphyrinogen oxidase [Faecalibacter rhinopitheci]|uniref:coproporphyrinogen oxidase n=1 Tax=Faecalibacter rhinopitheci TaxID=2779678 RepID=A0A8J7FNI2_9FLAO|nr:oxygen-dependent coproporphyrinogen oxidase [Faecalibacter rhinopitheci]MBF0596339.1 oxygen-dependent coproporphyrinogen oxidase [Faecalibacter rhinopitheci]